MQVIQKACSFSPEERYPTATELSIVLQRMADNLDAHFVEHFQEIIEMRHAEELTIVQIAKLLEMNMETVKKGYYRALDEVHQICLAQESREPD